MFELIVDSGYPTTLMFSLLIIILVCAETGLILENPTGICTVPAQTG